MGEDSNLDFGAVGGDIQEFCGNLKVLGPRGRAGVVRNSRRHQQGRAQSEHGECYFVV